MKTPLPALAAALASIVLSASLQAQRSVPANASGAGIQYAGLEADGIQSAETARGGAALVDQITAAIEAEAARAAEPGRSAPAVRADDEVRAASDRDARGYLGIVLAADAARVRVAEPLPGSPAASAGLRAGDVLTAVGGRRVTDLASLEAAMAPTRAGQTVVVDFQRRGVAQWLEVELGSRKVLGTASRPAPPSSADRSPARRGARLGPMGKPAPKGARGKAAPKGARGKAAPKGARGKAAPKGARGKAAPKGTRDKTAPNGARGKAAPKGAKGKSEPKSAKDKRAKKKSAKDKRAKNKGAKDKRAKAKGAKQAPPKKPKRAKRKSAPKDPQPRVVPGSVKRTEDGGSPAGAARQAALQRKLRSLEREVAELRSEMARLQRQLERRQR
ncbi:MAG: PDZ domain-containing protein [Planctomycetota bacterium]